MRTGPGRADVLPGTVAILAQGTSWAVAVTQAFLLCGSNLATHIATIGFVKIFQSVTLMIASIRSAGTLRSDNAEEGVD